MRTVCTMYNRNLHSPKEEDLVLFWHPGAREERYESSLRGYHPTRRAGCLPLSRRCSYAH